MDKGLSETSVSILQDSPTEHTKKAHYKHIQQCYLAWCDEQNWDGLAPDPAQVINFFAECKLTLNWKAATVVAYCAQILALFPSTTPFDMDPNFQHFFSIMQSNEVKCSRDMDIAIQPCLDHFHQLPNNYSMKETDLCNKLAWMLAVLGFLQTSNIKCIDIDHTHEAQGALVLSIVHPKETHGGKHVDKTVTLQPHLTEMVLCPVATYNAYIYCFVHNMTLAVPHPTLPSLTTNPLFHHLGDPHQHIHSEAINHCIQVIMRLIPLLPGIKSVKGRAMGSTLASQNGIGADDITLHGHWASAKVFLDHYCLSSTSKHNFTMTICR